MLLIGLTGSIAVGKTTVAKLFSHESISVYDADSMLHELYAKGGKAVQAIQERFPEAIIEGCVDRARLSDYVIADLNCLAEIESITHPLLYDSKVKFLQEQSNANAKMVVLDIPLLFETQTQNSVDVVIVVDATYKLQRERALERPFMTEEKLSIILGKQVPQEEKCKKADFIVDNSGSVENTHRQVREIILSLRKKKARMWLSDQYNEVRM